MNKIKEAFEISIKLWTSISNCPDTTIFEYPSQIKKHYLNILNLPKMFGNCAFCDHMVRNKLSCRDCELKSICSYEYTNWTDEFENSGTHVQKNAKIVLDAIIKKYNKWKEINYE